MEKSMKIFPLTLFVVLLNNIPCFSQNSSNISPTSKKPKNSWMGRLADKSFVEIGLFIPFERANTSMIDLTTSQIQVSKMINLRNEPSIGLYSNYNYSLIGKKISVGLSVATTLKGFNNIKIGLAHHQEIAFKKSTLYVSPGIALSSFGHYSHLLDVQGPLLIEGHKFGDNTSIYMHKQNIGIQASIRIAFRINRLVDFFISPNYLISLTQREKILYEDISDSLFSKEYNQSTSSPDIQLMVNGNKTNHWPLELNPFIITIGISNKLR